MMHYKIRLLEEAGFRWKASFDGCEKTAAKKASKAAVKRSNLKRRKFGGNDSTWTNRVIGGNEKDFGKWCQPSLENLANVLV